VTGLCILGYGICGRACGARTWSADSGTVRAVVGLSIGGLVLGGCNFCRAASQGHLGEYFFEQSGWNSAALGIAGKSLGACFSTAWCCFVARVAVLTDRSRSPPIGVRPNVGGFHSGVAVLAIGDGV
jgi:hypothetical protein